MLGQEKADWIRELEEDEVLKDIRKREVDEIVGEACKKAYMEGFKFGLELGIKKGLEQGLKECLEQGLKECLEQGLKEGFKQRLEQGLERVREERRKLLQENIPQIRAKGFADQEIMSMLDIDSL
jgi:flagellar biosynthesis/type III secretory pathway protein FliH